MKSRCFEPSDVGYDRYGGRGIEVCERWLVFENFYEDMGERPVGTTLGRKDNDDDYRPGNCGWETVYEQANNTSKTVWVVWRGERRPLAPLCREFGMSGPVVYGRLKLGWALEDALLVPIRAYRPGSLRSGGAGARFKA